MTEKPIEQKFKRICERHGMRVFKMSTQFESHVPDRLVLYNGFAGFAEIKAPGKKQTPAQAAAMRTLEKQGNFVGVIDNPNDVVGWIGNFINHINSYRDPHEEYRLSSSEIKRIKKQNW